MADLKELKAEVKTEKTEKVNKRDDSENKVQGKDKSRKNYSNRIGTSLGDLIPKIS